jgi:ATP-binding cassette subfamily B protein
VAPPSITPAARQQRSFTWHAARVLFPFVRPHWRGFLPALVSVVAVAILSLAKPWPLKFLVDDVLRVERGGPGPSIPGRLILGIAAAIVAIAVLQGLFSFIKEYFLTAASYRVAFGVRRGLFGHLQRLSLSFHDRQHTGEVITRVTNDVTKTQELVTDKLLVDGTSSVLQFFGVLGVMLVVDWRLALVALGWAPLVWIAAAHFRTRIQNEEREVRARESDMTSLTQETLSSIRVVKAFGRERFAQERFDERTGEMLEASVTVSRLEARYGWVMTTLTSFGLAALILVGAYRVAAGALSAGTLVVFIQYMRDLQGPVRTVSRLWAKLAKVMVRIERIVEVFDERPAVRERPGARPAPRLRGDIRVQGVSFGYHREQPVLNGIDLSLAPGETVAVVGPTGSGKSTLASLLLRLWDPDTGAVTVDGHDLRDLKLDSYLDQVGVVLQESLLFQTSIRENIAYGRPGATAAEIEEAARVANCLEFVHRLPQGFDTVVGERGTTLSGGQRQRIAIARAVVRDAPILILDEPTTGLDAAAEDAVMRALERLMDGRTTLMIAHKLSTVRRADRICVLERGRMVEMGSHEELVAASGRYARSLSLQTG